ncbi:MAG: DUF3618 domain-containing protein [Phycisphaeraceae bacterium]
MAEKTVPVNQRETDPQALRADIADTRRRLGETLDIVQERLSPSYLKTQAIRIMKQRSKEAGYRVRDTIRANPWPLLITGAGLTWMIGSLSRGIAQRRPSQRIAAEREQAPSYEEQGRERESVTDQARQQSERFRAQAQDIGHRASQRASEFGHQVSDRASQMGEQVRGQSQQAFDSIQSTYKAHPLTMGLATLAAGLAAGMLIPASRKEQQWMGETSRDLMEEAKHYGKDAFERGKHVAERTYETAKEEAKQEAQSESESFKREVQGEKSESGGEQQQS